MISVSPSGHSTSGRQGIRTLKARRPHGLANRPGEPYPATFRFSGPDGSRTHHTDLARIGRLQRLSGPSELSMDDCGFAIYSRSLRTTQSAILNHQSKIDLIPDGVEPSSPACRAGVFAVGPRDRVDNDRDGNRTHRITRLSTSSLFLFAYPAVCVGLKNGGFGSRTRRSRLMRPRWALAHPRHLVQPSRLRTNMANCRSRFRTGLTGLMKANWAPALLQ